MVVEISSEKSSNACVIIPTYNNEKTIVAVINEVKKYSQIIIVVNDGSTDGSSGLLRTLSGIELIEYKKNNGKGYALKMGFKKALKMGFDYTITIDADGQHFPADIPLLLSKLAENPDSLIIGRRNITADGMPSKNTFANRFSNFWFWAETGIKLSDTQSGFRLYPIHLYRNWKFFTQKYEFEIEVLVRSAWNDIPIHQVPINVYYPPESERVSHFRPFFDFTRISLLNTVLVLLTVFYIWPLRFIKYLGKNKFSSIIREQLLMHNEQPARISYAIGFGVFMGIVPIWGFQMLTAAFLAHLLKLNKILVLVAANISLPPLIPFFIYFSYLTGGLVLQSEGQLTAESVSILKNQLMEGNFWNTLVEFGYSFYQYVIGSFVLAVIAGLLSTAISFAALHFFKPFNMKSK